LGLVRLQTLGWAIQGLEEEGARRESREIPDRENTTCTTGGHKSLDSDSCGAGGVGGKLSPLCVGQQLILLFTLSVAIIEACKSSNTAQV